MKEIGGYFELELRKGKEYHKDAIRLNTGRNALELILKVKKYKKVFIPYYTCDVILEAFKKINIPYELYSIDNNFEPIFKFSILKDKEGFLYINYFGLKDIFISELVNNCKNLIIDNSQSFYSLPEKGVPTFYSCRKFFGVPDGAYLYLDGFTENDFPIDYSETRFKHLLKRIEYGAEAGYIDFKNNDNELIGKPIKKMSKLTKALLCNIDYEYIKEKRIENYLFLHKYLSNKNKLHIQIEKGSIPMIYPFLTNQFGLKQKLIENKIYIATYWPNVLKSTKEYSLEYKYANQILSLPIDQRYNTKNLSTIIRRIQ
jgi:hypothetical protein